MWRMEDVLSELNESEKSGGLPPGFRFHPTDEELITFYLASKVFCNASDNVTTPVHIAEVDLNKCEPWDLPERAKMGEKEWYLYSLRDRKYPTGLRTNRATGSGYWKATGKDRQVYAASISTTAAGRGHGGAGLLIGMKKTLVFYQGRAPRGVKTRWVMHEYRLDGHFSSFRLSSKEEWVICRVFHKHGGEKKTAFYPPPLSPFLSCLPPLTEMPVTTSSPSTATGVLDCSSRSPRQSSHDANFLLHSLLSNPLPNFSSISDANIIFPPPYATLQNTADASTASTGLSPSSVLFNPKSSHHSNSHHKQLPSLIADSHHKQLPSLIADITAAAPTTVPVPKRSTYSQHYQHLMDKIPPQFPNLPQYHPLVYDEMDLHPNSYTNGPDNDDDDDATAHVDRLLHQSVNLHAESWHFHP